VLISGAAHVYALWCCGGTPPTIFAALSPQCLLELAAPSGWRVSAVQVHACGAALRMKTKSARYEAESAHLLSNHTWLCCKQALGAYLYFYTPWRTYIHNIKTGEHQSNRTHALIETTRYQAAYNTEQGIHCTTIAITQLSVVNLPASAQPSCLHKNKVNKWMNKIMIIRVPTKQQWQHIQELLMKQATTHVAAVLHTHGAMIERQLKTTSRRKTSMHNNSLEFVSATYSLP
jgi:hypothetical protein